MEFDKWVPRLLPIALAGTILAVYLRHQVPDSGRPRSLPPGAAPRVNVPVDCKVLQQVYEDGGWKMVLEIEVRHDCTYLSRRGLYFENKESIEKTGKIPQDIFAALQ